MYAENQTKWLPMNIEYLQAEPLWTLAKPNIWFPVFNMNLTYDNTLQLQEANVEVVIHNVEGDEKIDVIMT